MQEKQLKMESDLPSRRESTEALIQIAGNVGTLTGKVDQFIERAMEIIEKHDERIEEAKEEGERANKRLDAATNRAWGIGIGSAFGGGSLGAFLMKLFH
jgi:outer membrane murein-binding lipoprotein Lpp